MSEANLIDDLVLLDLHFSGLLKGEQCDEVCQRLATDPAFQALAEQYLTDWMDLLDILATDALVPDGAEERLMQRLAQTAAIE